MTIDSASAFLGQVRQHQLVDVAQLEELAGLAEQYPQVKALAAELLRRGWLTRFQIGQLLRGRGPYLVLASYILLDQLGEGATGYIFKARHRSLHRLAAVKVIRRELLVKSSAVERFYREVHAIGLLRHPNIVQGYDAGPVGPTHFFAMEFVQGTDLNRLVQRNGPMELRAACDAIRQTALGLQHAYEKGMIHRDIKPSNLILSETDQVVKVLDLGLVRLDRASAAASIASGSLTEAGSLLGTPDFVAPEQLEDSRAVDIRADIYSLGATLYFLLSGKVPFPDCTLYQKLVRVQVAEPVPIEQVRADLPPSVGQVLRHMMAKRPEDRYQVPNDVANALAEFVGAAVIPASTFRPATPSLRPASAAAPLSQRDTAQGSWGTLDISEAMPPPSGSYPTAVPPPSGKHPSLPGQPPNDYRQWLLIGLGALGALVVMFLLLLAANLLFAR